MYVTCRELKGAIKASLHESGTWHLAFDRRFVAASGPPALQEPGARFIRKWGSPPALAPGVVLAVRVVTPADSVSTIAHGRREVVRLPVPAPGFAVECDVFLVDPGVRVSSWPGRATMHTSLVGSYVLDSGRSVWVVYRIVREPKLPPMGGRPQFFAGQTLGDLKSAHLRMIAIGQEPDGSRVLYDLRVAPLE